MVFTIKDKKRSVLRVRWLMGWASPLVGLVAVLSMLTLGTCQMSRAASHAAYYFLLGDVQTDRTVDVWKTIINVVQYLSKGLKQTQQVGATRLWTSRREYFFKTCVCWPASNPTTPPYTQCLSMATLDHNAHPCAPYHPATNGWVKRPMKGLRRFYGRKVYKYSGFHVDLDLDQDPKLVTLSQYENFKWLDWNTEAVVLEVALYEPSTACILYVQLGFELDPSRMWRTTMWVWATCEACTKVNNWMSHVLRLALVLHTTAFLLEVPWSHLKRFLRALPRLGLWWPGKTLLLNLVVLGMYWAVVVTETMAQNRLAHAWQVPRAGKSVFPSVIAVGITDIADTFTLLLVVLAMLQAAQVCTHTVSELGPAVVRLARLLTIVAAIVVPFSVALHQLGVSVASLGTVEDSMLAVTAAFLGEIDVTSLLASTQITGLVMFFLLFTVFTLLLFPFVVEVLSDRQDLQPETPRSPERQLHFRDRLSAFLSTRLPP